MTKNKAETPGDAAVAHLQDAIEQLQKDMVRVEVWAGALTGFTKPVPNYEPNDDYLLKTPPKPVGGN